MDGRGRCMDNIFIERLWRSLKYEEVYLKEYEFSVMEARAGKSQNISGFTTSNACIRVSITRLPPRSTGQSMRADMGRKERWERKENLSFKEKSRDTQRIGTYSNGRPQMISKKPQTLRKESLLAAKNGLDNGVHFKKRPNQRPSRVAQVCLEWSVRHFVRHTLSVPNRPPTTFSNTR